MHIQTPICLDFWLLPLQSSLRRLPQMKDSGVSLWFCFLNSIFTIGLWWKNKKQQCVCAYVYTYEICWKTLQVFWLLNKDVVSSIKLITNNKHRTDRRRQTAAKTHKAASQINSFVQHEPIGTNSFQSTTNTKTKEKNKFISQTYKWNKSAQHWFWAANIPFFSWTLCKVCSGNSTEALNS